MTPKWKVLATTSLAVAVLLSTPGCNGSDSMSSTEPTKPAATRTYTFHVDGPEVDMPYYPAVVVRVTEAGEWTDAERLPFDLVRSFEVHAAPGERWQVRTEVSPSKAELRMFWQIDTGGKFGDDTDVHLPLPPRMRITATAPTSALGVDAITFYDEETSTAGWALNDPNQSLFEAVVSGEDRRSYMRVARPRPFVCDGFGRGKYVVAGHIPGHYWTAVRVDLTDRGTFTLATATQPTGGGTVICEDGDALLLLNGDLPIPCPTKNVELAYRATWENVPPGKHAVRFPDGHEEPITVTDGADVRLPRRP